MAGDPDEVTGFQLELPYELGRYRLDAEIGRGGMGIVYHAEDTLLERPVAVKVLIPQLAADGQFVQRFKREAQMAARLEHPCIVTVHDVGQVEGLVYFVMRFVSGKPLDRLIEEGLPWSRGENIAIQVADAMAYAHGNGVIHRDIKPDNVIVSREGTVTITDFGLARPEQSGSGPTQAGIILGTPGYMAPEQALGKPVDGRADIYAFGVMLFELITGQLPFDGETAFSIINQHISTPPPKVNSVQKNCPAWLADLVDRLLAKEPDQRPQSMAQVAEMLRSQQGTVIAAQNAPAGDQDTTAQGLVQRIRKGELTLADALTQHPEVRQTLEEVFRRELTVVSFDLAGSTALKQAGGGTVAIGPVFNAYRTLVDDVLQQHHCAESIWAGDGTVAIFELPSEAVAAAQQIVRGLRGINQQFADAPDLGVRIGIHTGGVLRDPNQSLGQVTSSTLDVTGHLQKDARPGLVEVSQATLDKLPSQEGWLRIRTAREGNLAIFAWHPDGPDHVPQSWIQRMMYGPKPAEEVAKEAKDPKVRDAQRTTGPGTDKTRRPAPKTGEILHCPLCEGEVTAKDQKCPSCGRLNRHYDPAVAEKGWFKKPAAQPARRPSQSAHDKRTTLVQQRMTDAKRRTQPGVTRAGTPAAKGAKGAKKTDDQISPEALGEMLLGVVIGAAAWVGIGYVLRQYASEMWWVDTGSAVRSSYLAVFVPGIVLAVIGAGVRATQPALGAGLVCGLPIGLVLLRFLKIWV